MFEFFFEKVLLKSIQYFWAQKVLPIPVSIPSGKIMGHTSTNTKKYCQYFIAHTFLPRDASAERGNAIVSRPSVRDV